MKDQPINDDDAQLASMGHAPELKRNFSMMSMLGLAFAIMNSWTALSASLSLSITSGGGPSVVWGVVTAGICTMCIAVSLAEFLSAYPTIMEKVDAHPYMGDWLG
ncbi:Gaba permease [Aspergillus sclerotialis]|uniref:Gaba permease n=1 Tax=Aspergillus sclerotialis TaxID=2070753 RepID=A0A3A2Z740_9EURO|nr:Gaba permease [Aspergillus sclerotialis]